MIEIGIDLFDITYVDLKYLVFHEHYYNYLRFFQYARNVAISLTNNVITSEVGEFIREKMLIRIRL